MSLSPHLHSQDGSSNSIQKIASTIDHSFTWENFTHIKSTILTNVFIDKQTQISAITTQE